MSDCHKHCVFNFSLKITQIYNACQRVSIIYKHFRQNCIIFHTSQSLEINNKISNQIKIPIDHKVIISKL